MTRASPILRTFLVALGLVLVIACRPGPAPVALTPAPSPSASVATSLPATAAATPGPAAPASTVTATPVAVSPSPASATALASTPAPTRAGSATVAPTSLPTAPPRDLIDLQRRLRPGALPAATATPGPRVNVAVGSETTFWIANQQAKTYFQISARVALKTDHVYWFLQDGVDLALADLQSSASYFETQTYPTEHRLFGSEGPPGPDGDAHITILVGRIPGVAGYFSSADAYPRQVNPYSNERKMMYMNVDAVHPGLPGFNFTLAHEFMHMIQFNVHRDQDAWINEGSAELAAQAVTGTTSDKVHAYERQPATQLTQWESMPSDALPHYGAAYLFMRYVAEHFGGFPAIGRVVAQPGRSTVSFDQFFQPLSPPRTFDDVYADWVAANVIGDLSLDSGRYGYHDLRLNLPVQTGPGVGGTAQDQAIQHAATYYRVDPDRAATLEFRGSPTVQLIAADPHGARFEWWSNRGDSIDSRLTRSVDLSAVTKATLGFWIWYDLEESYDYAYVEASTDGGATWATLKANDTTTANPNGQNYGNGFTGTSGGKTPTWVHESVDLGPYVGKRLLLRFEYVTDESYNADGLALDDVQIPDIGLTDDASTDNGWQAEGFARVDNRERQTYLVEAIAPGGRDPVRRMSIGPDGHGTLPLDANQSVIVAVAGTAPITIHRAPYTLQIVAR